MSAEVPQDEVDDAAAVGGGGVGIERLQRLEAEDAVCVDAKRVPKQMADFGGVVGAWSDVPRRARPRTRARAVGLGPIQLPCPVPHASIVQPFEVEAAGLQHRLQPLQPARGHRGIAALIAAAGAQHHRLCAGGLDEVVGGKADALVHRGQSGIRPHRPRQPRAAHGRPWPAALLEPGEDHQIG